MDLWREWELFPCLIQLPEREREKEKEKSAREKRFCMLCHQAHGLKWRTDNPFPSLVFCSVVEIEAADFSNSLTFLFFSFLSNSVPLSLN